MSCTLEQYHINPIKLGLVLQQYSKEKGITKAALSRQTGISRDTITHIFNGDTQEVSFEKLMKICVVIGISLGMLVAVVTKDDDIGFRDRIVFFDPSNNDILPVTAVDDDAMPVPETVAAVAEAVTVATTAADPARPAPSTEEHVAFLQQHIVRLTALLELAMRGHDR